METNTIMATFVNAQRRVCTRVLLHNPGGIGVITKKRCKETLEIGKLKKLVLDYNFDIVGLI